MVIKFGVRNVWMIDMVFTILRGSVALEKSPLIVVSVGLVPCLKKKFYWLMQRASQFLKFCLRFNPWSTDFRSNEEQI